MSEPGRKKTVLSIRQKLSLSYLILVFFIFLIGSVGAFSIYMVNRNGSMIYSDHLQAVNILRNLNQNLWEIDRDVVLLTTDTGTDSKTDYIYNIRMRQTENGQLLIAYSQITPDDAQFEDCRSQIEAYDNKVNSILDGLDMMDNTQESVSAIESLEQDVSVLLDDMIARSIEAADNCNAENQRIFNTIIKTVIIVCLAAAAIAALIAVYISSYLTKRLETIRSFAKRMAEYNISDDIEDVSDDEIGRTMVALNDSQFMIRELIEKIVNETTIMSDMGEDISAALRRIKERLQSVSMMIMQSGQMANGMDSTLSEVLASGEVEENAAASLRKLLPISEEARTMLVDAMGEMNSINMQLEQIAVTSDHQNELANDNRERIQQFRSQPQTEQHTEQEE